VDPDLCVALGAAVEGALIAGDDVHSVLVDITAHSMGVRALHEEEDVLKTHYFSVIIPKGSPLPTSRSEVYTTVTDRQEVVDVVVYQGEDEDVRRNVKLGNFRVEGLAPVPAGNEIVVYFTLTLDGTLTVRASEKTTGLNRHIVIDDAIHAFGKEEREQAARRLGDLFAAAGEEDEPEDDAAEDDDLLGEEDLDEEGDGKEEGAAAGGPPAGASDPPAPAVLGDETGREILRTVERVRALLEKMVPEDREDAVAMIERATAGLREGRIDRAREAGKDLEELLFYLEEA
jgi:molecular chaperone DnaK